MYTVKTKGDKKLIEGGYIPEGHSCKCKECKFTIEVPKCATEDQIKEIIEKIKKL